MNCFNDFEIQTSGLLFLQVLLVYALLKLHSAVHVLLPRYKTHTDAHVPHKDNTRQFSLNIKAVHGSKDGIKALCTRCLSGLFIFGSWRSLS